jgi:phosphoribosylaminoimidazole-succinocarboxamide synthase
MEPKRKMSNNEKMPEALFESRLTALTRLSQGKVRDIYEIDANHLLIVTSDRISAFDVILPDPIPGKGVVLTDLTRFWLEKTADIVDNHLVELQLEDVIADPVERATVASRAMVVRRLRPLPIEAVVRGYLIGSGWKDYQATGKVCGIDLPTGLPLAGQLPEPIFTPASKAEIGEHDENISFSEVEALIGKTLAARVRDFALEIYMQGAAHAAERDIIVADTKFEFGLDDDDNLYLIDEVLTPDSSRFWAASEYATGISPPSFDKQFVRDYLETLDWNKKAPGPRLPAEIIEKTLQKYQLALDQLQGQALTS